MSVELHHECTRVPVTASASCGPLFLAAEGPFVRFYNANTLTCLTSKSIFRAQAVHGISVLSISSSHAVLMVWGGWLVRVCEFDLQGDDKDVMITPNSWIFSNTAEAPDWILHLSPEPRLVQDGNTAILPLCAAVTAHNALLELKTTYTNKSPTISVAELTFSSRSILYSAHLTWASHGRILIAAGTAFGEIIFWTWTKGFQTGSGSQTQRVFLGHEGSIFGVRISKLYRKSPDQSPQRFVASCSDDRTIRIWDVSDISSQEGVSTGGQNLDYERTHHTGFTNPSFDSVSSSECLAIGWGHISRVWDVQFLEYIDETLGIFLLSSGEDATTRTWSFTRTLDSAGQGAFPFQLSQLDIAAYHNGKNIWASTIHSPLPESPQIFAGGADSKITVCSVGASVPLLGHSGCISSEYTIDDITSIGPQSVGPNSTKKKSSKAEAGFFRSYTFIDDTSYLLTTNIGKVYLGVTAPAKSHSKTDTQSPCRMIGHSSELSGYSVSAGVASLGVAFVAGSTGSVYMYYKQTGVFSLLYTATGKVGCLFAAAYDHDAIKGVILFLTIAGQNSAQLLHVAWPESGLPVVARHDNVPLAAAGAGLTVTSISYIPTNSNDDYLILGFRQGSLAIYRTNVATAGVEATAHSTSWIRTSDKVHGKEAVSCLSWSASDIHSGYLISTGRDGHLVMHLLDLKTGSLNLVHDLSLPVGPNVEGISLIGDRILVYGFSSKHFILYDVNAEEELISVDTGGAHRSWAFQPHRKNYGCGALVWTRGSSMNTCQQLHPSHDVVRQGGHGREIKAVAATKNSDSQLIATGAEDTDIKVLQYRLGSFIGSRTLRKHKTGIQHLQWSDDGRYLFSSGGCEEFYIWRVRTLPSKLGPVGAVCESVCKPESEHADLRLMSFDVRNHNGGFIISMVFSDSNIKVYHYNATAAEPWHSIATGTYFTSCLTQCVFLSPSLVFTAGTDGHAVLWPLKTTEFDATCKLTSIETLKWRQPIRIHQSSSKTLAAESLDSRTMLLASGGDDGSISFLVISVPLRAGQPNVSDMEGICNMSRPVTVVRTHASAVTACAIIAQGSRVFVVTSGNDQWLRLWELCLSTMTHDGSRGTDQYSTKNIADVKRLGKVKSSVADVSSMAVLEQCQDQRIVRLLVCGVGMEVIRVEM
ncbi:unnamed protein product [Periconia digitata]|uniref:WD40 repeat-like protein n=1 Tax=Periconia digitata TaxID=1303443 RepID=A0A9W4UHI5_9PLEO|nr:unnamed protein product [Periconia digitata]